MSDVYYGYSARLMAQMARAIGRTAEAEAYERLFGRIKQAFITKYLSTEGGRVTVKSSRGDASPIEPGADPIQKHSYAKDDGFGPVSMNSFNHYAYGAIMEWMYAYMAGIAHDPDSPGFKRFLLQPHIDPTGRITKVSGAYESPYGEIRSEWDVDDARRTLGYYAVVPANSEATLRLPAASADSVREGRTPLARVDGVRFLGHADGVCSYRLLSGQYRLTALLH